MNSVRELFMRYQLWIFERVGCKTFDDADKAKRIAERLRNLARRTDAWAVPRLAQLLNGGSETWQDTIHNARLNLVYTIGAIPCPEAQAVLIHSLGDHDPGIAEDANSALIQISDLDWKQLPEATQAIAHFIGILQRPYKEGEDSSPMFEAAKALGMLGDAQAVGPLIGAVRKTAVSKSNTQEAMARTVSYAVLAIDHLPIDPLIEVASDPDPWVRHVANMVFENLHAANLLDMPRAISKCIGIMPNVAVELGLMRATGQVFEEDTEKWQAWWQANRQECVRAKIEELLRELKRNDVTRFHRQYTAIELQNITLQSFGADGGQWEDWWVHEGGIFIQSL